MLTHTLLRLAVLAGPAFALPSPPHRQTSNTTGDAQTSTGSAAISSHNSSCTAEYVVPNTRDCGQVALANGIQLGVYESYYPSSSRHCQRILRNYGICPVEHPTTASPSAFPTATPVNSISNSTVSSNRTSSVLSDDTTGNNATHGRGGSNFTEFDASVLATGVVTLYDAKTLTYTIGTSGVPDLRTVVVTHTSLSAVTFTTMATVVGIPAESEAKATPSPTLVPARVVLEILPESTKTLTTEYEEHGTYTALTTVASRTGASRVHDKRQTETCIGEMAVAIESSAASVIDKRQVPTCANAVSAPVPTASGAVIGCSEWHVVVPGETCATIATEYGIQPATFKLWNPAIDASCYNLLTGIAYCVSRCGLTSEPSSPSAANAGINTAVTASSSTSAFQNGMWTPATLSTTSAAAAGISPLATLSVASSWLATGYTIKSLPSEAPMYPQSGFLAASVSSYSSMAVAFGSPQNANSQASHYMGVESIGVNMATSGPVPVSSMTWKGFSGAMSIPTPSVAMNGLASTSLEDSISPSTVPFMAPVSSLESSPKLEVPQAPSSKLEIAQNYSSNPVPYKTYSGNGSVAAGWPTMEQWLDFETLFAINKPTMLSGCSTWDLPNDSEEEIANIKSAIKSVAAESDGIDERFILAIIMQESKGCVRVKTTFWAVPNPGLMQTHQGTGSCNTPTVQTPCPDSEIVQMVKDGTLGTAEGDGLEQCKQKQASGQSDTASGWYRTARQYNGGSIAANGNLEEGCCTLTYASDVANRLTGYVDPPPTSS